MLQATIVKPAAAPIGMYVEYKSTPYIVVDFNSSNTLFKLTSPTNGRVQVGARNINMMDVEDAVTVELQGRKFLRTVHGTIISLTTGRVVYEMDCDSHRKAILAAVA